jgi:4-hydroxybenzoate polyprenyltransferase
MLIFEQMNAPDTSLPAENKPNVFFTLFQMSRPINLLLIGYTFICFHFGLGSRLHSTFQFDSFLGHGFLLLTILLTASAGNFINDYFDKKVDAVNKPNQISIDKKIKRRVVILAHVLTNLVALICAFAASKILHSWMPIVITPLIIFLLTIYTPYLKKMYLVGNIAVSFCIAIIPLWALWPEVIREANWLVQSWTFVFILFAFFISLTREIIKDIEDVEGDTVGNYQTVAVKSGIGVAKLLSLFSLLTTLFIAGVAWLLYLSSAQSWVKQIYVALIFIPLSAALIVLLFSRTKRGYSISSAALKIAMLFGITFSLFLR